MSKYVNGLKGNQVMPTYKNKADRLKDVRAKLADAIASGNEQLAQSYRRYISFHTRKA